MLLKVLAVSGMICDIIKRFQPGIVSNFICQARKIQRTPLYQQIFKNISFKQTLREIVTILETAPLIKRIPTGPGIEVKLKNCMAMESIFELCYTRLKVFSHSHWYLKKFGISVFQNHQNLSTFGKFGQSNLIVNSSYRNGFV